MTHLGTTRVARWSTETPRRFVFGTVDSYQDLDPIRDKKTRVQMSNFTFIICGSPRLVTQLATIFAEVVEQLVSLDYRAVALLLKHQPRLFGLDLSSCTPLILTLNPFVEPIKPRKDSQASTAIQSLHHLSQLVMEQNPYDPNFHQRFKIDEEIIQLENRLQILRVKRNSLVPISSLPEEILVEIFLLANTHDETGLVLSEWILEIGWVCHMWRKTALSHAVLWTEIGAAMIPEGTQGFLSRSGSAPIYLSIHFSDEERDLIAALPSELYRIRELKLANKGDLREDVEIVLTAPAPILRCVMLWGFQLPQKLFSGVAPSLRSMNLVCCPGFSFDNFTWLSHLTELILHLPVPKPTVRQLLIGLKVFPHLQRLTLNDALDEQTLPEAHASLESLPPIDLPDLQSISISSCTMWLIPQLISRIAVNPDRDVVADILDDDRFAHLCFSAAREDYPTAITKLMTSPVTPQELHHLILSRLGGYLSSLKSLRLEGNNKHWVSTGFWATILSPLPNIQSMKLGSIYATSFIEYMDSLTAATSSPPPFPALRHLTLENVSEHRWPIPSIAHLFFQALKARKEARLGLGELVINLDFSIPEFDDAQFAECADKVQIVEGSS
ncbi:hypothetical protein BDN72DRAFT_876452 [Pluteus cervinus]|uniref:Uncharacterized protein n=1 Tax=Pluteus cervinus TaxID=181527 RepID=A0ACD3B327_9AGAR|nr:hypothetical protein BDN72DRAFT_876452 [Pluteus cervinus]